eukprot:3393580-Pyramimonas_sp.AAC.1
MAGNTQCEYEKGGQLVVQTVNANSWTSAAAFVLGTTAHIVLVQEHKLHGQALLEAKERLRKQGAHLDVWQPPSESVALAEARILHCYFRSESLGVVSIYGNYWKDEIGLGEQNLRLAVALGNDIARRSLPYISGGDHNLEPHLFREGFSPHRLNGQLVIPNPSQTCLSSTPGRCYDYFLISKNLLAGVESAKADMQSDLFPHRPVTLRFKQGVGTIMIQRLLKYQKLPVDLPIGPAPQAPRYDRILETLEDLILPFEKDGGVRLPGDDERERPQQGLDDQYESG